ncbi:hypothetical protein GCM10027265_20590 [Jatrophihabitans fulvus]
MPVSRRDDDVHPDGRVSSKSSVPTVLPPDGPGAPSVANGTDTDGSGEGAADDPEGPDDPEAPGESDGAALPDNPDGVPSTVEPQPASSTSAAAHAAANGTGRVTPSAGRRTTRRRVISRWSHGGPATVRARSQVVLTKP